MGYVDDSAAPLWKGYFYALLMLIAAFMQSWFDQQFFADTVLLGMRARIICSGLVYEKVI